MSMCVYWYEDIYVPSLVVSGPETLHGMCSIHGVKWCVLNTDMVMLYLHTMRHQNMLQEMIQRDDQMRLPFSNQSTIYNHVVTVRAQSPIVLLVRCQNMLHVNG